MKKSNRCAFADMNGGVDSTATCLMLQEQGYGIVGVTMRVWGGEPQDARELAVRVGVKYYMADERVPSKDAAVKSFVDEYRQGRTPNPCVMCDPLFKLRMLIEWADKLDCGWIATGYYSRLEKWNGYIYIVAGDDEKKDQSYFLQRLRQSVLRHCIFPLGNYTKQTVRDCLREKGCEAKSKKGGSMEVCFIRGDHQGFLRGQCPEPDAETGPGRFVSPEGVRLGQYRGFLYYTIGQRKGLEIAPGKPAHVLKINPQRSTVVLGNTEQLRAGYMVAEQDSIADEDELPSYPKLAVRIRYRSHPIPCRMKRLEDERLLIRFLAETSAIAPGQSAVLYDGRRVIGGVSTAPQRGIGLAIKQNKSWE